MAAEQPLLPAPVLYLEEWGVPSRFPLAPCEEGYVARATPGRLAEFAAARALARRGLLALGLPPAAVPAGAGGEPRWPVGVVGSLTHSAGYRACALTFADLYAAVGIDAEPDQPLRPHLARRVTLQGELCRAQRLAGGHGAARLLFSAKETAYKAHFSLVGRPLALDEVEVQLEGGPHRGTFALALRGAADRRLAQAEGRWEAKGGMLRTALLLPRSPNLPAACSAVDRPPPTPA